ncbi:CRISPR-associated protein Cas4 [Streptomyces marincola]|uniref:CRISPR-associated protein Cas4 n=1 Tax=Streptomyces marincola TaxID=2878388 RepID=UPI001CF48B88|nr:CRISPR-associated protein Cas4 [Streptomyces marincola]UCM87976.1 CRISPR-associated protein Cas4 [Streptomyces marincola]
MISDEDVGGVHIKYLHHCRRQLWLYLRGIRPEHLNATVQLGEAVHDSSYPRHSPVDLGAAKLDFVDGHQWVHEVKSSSRPTDADRAQAYHYCHQLARFGNDVKGAILHYPATRRTVRLPYTPEATAQAEEDIQEVLSVATALTSPDRLPRNRCRGCSYIDYCWTE